MNYKYIYKDIDDSFGKRRVLFTQNWTQFPLDPANTDAVEFAKWMQEGNRPEPAEEGGTVTDEWVAETIAKLLP